MYTEVYTWVMLQVVHYVTIDGKDPFGEWLHAQDDGVRARVLQRIDRVRRENFGDHKKLGAGLSELRISHGPGYRVYYGRAGQHVVVLLAGGTKKRQAQDIQRAQTYWKAYKQEKRHARQSP